MPCYEDQGNGTAVLFIHGHPFNRTMWAPQILALRERYRVVAPDLRGYGESSARQQSPVTLEEFAEDMVDLLDALNIEKAHVVGLSMGGQIAMELGRRFPERILGMVLAATSPEAETEAGVIQRNLLAERILSDGMALLGCEMLPKLLGRRAMTLLPETAATVYRMICLTAPEAAAAAVRGRALRRDYREALQDFSFPCLIVVGDEDVFTSVAQTKVMSEMIPHSRLEVFNSVGHLPNLEAPDRFNTALLRFLQSHQLDGAHGAPN